MEQKKKKRTPAFVRDIISGYAMGVAFIIPGFSGGSIAAILGIYEKLIGAVADIFKSFKKSIITLLPIAAGLVLGVVSLLFPLGWALDKFPLPTVSLFVGLTIGGMPSITDKLGGRPKVPHIISCVIPFTAALALSFLPISADVDLFNMNLLGYLLLFAVGILGSSALVIPGISGSMLLLILGYYNPILKVLTEHFLVGKDVGKSFLILASVGLGIVLGFYIISIIMKSLLEKRPRGTYYAIVGFILGSIPTVFISTSKDAGYMLSSLPSSAMHWVMCVLMLILGCVLSFSLVFCSKKMEKTQRADTGAAE